MIALQKAGELPKTMFPTVPDLLQPARDLTSLGGVLRRSSSLMESVLAMFP
jgi:hypothetical protein